MDRSSPLIACLAALIATAATAAASPQDADKVRKDWESAINQWTELTRKATSAPERELLFRKQPDAAAHIDRMWTVIGSSLDQEWTIEPASWFLLMAAGTTAPDAAAGKVRAERIEAIKKAVGDHHRRSAQLPTMCMALARLGDPTSLSLLESIQTDNPNPSVQGVAALGTAMVLRGLGDDPELLRRRLTLLRKAIIDSADVSIGENTVASIAENELYLIRYLSKGRVAPEITGNDAAGKPIRLSDLKGKVVILVFWNSSQPESEHAIQYTRELTRKFSGKPVEILGINHDSLVKLRGLIADETVNWKNISDPECKIAREYRVSAWPMAYVLDSQHKIQYSGNLGTFAELAAEALIR